MSTPKARPTLLSLLDRRFRARLRAHDLEGRVPDRKVLDALYDKNILHSAGVPDSAECGVGPHDGDGVVPVERQADGSYTGFCAEHRRRVSLAAEGVGWIEFDGERWASEVRGRNGLEGDPSLDPSGRMFLGVLRTQNSRVAMVALSPQAIGRHDSYRPPGPDAAPVLMVRLAETPPAATGDPPRASEIQANELFAEDMLTLRREALATVLKAMPNGLPTGTRFLKFSNAVKGPTPMGQDEYDRDVSREGINKADLVIDLPRERAWRDGREIRYMKNPREGGGKKKVSPQGLMLVSGYFKAPGRAMRPIDVPPYRGREDSRSPTSAMVMLANMRTTLRLDEIIKTANNPTGSPGGSLYVFDPPPSFKYTLIVATPES